MNIGQEISHAATPEKTIETSHLWNLEHGGTWLGRGSEREFS